MNQFHHFFAFRCQVYLHNPWLTYGIGIHRMREAGLGTDILDMLDEKPFSLIEIKAFCVEFFGKDVLSLRNPSVDVDGFFEDLQDIVDKEKLVWNPVKNKLCPWINVEKLKLMARRNAAGDQSGKTKPKISRRVTSVDPPESIRRANRPFAASVQHGPQADRPANNRRANRPFSASFQHGQAANSGRARSSLNASFTAKQAGFHRSTSLDSSLNMTGLSTKQPGVSGPNDLDEAIKYWSRVAPAYKKMKPLEVLLVEAPVLFPPTNRFVESHEHFFKWKAFSEDAFIGESEDELKVLLKRACRKCKLFLHPDKLPSDLTPNQDTLFRAMWDIIQELEMKMS